MREASPYRKESFVGNWAWAFPATYLAHIAEEHWNDFNGWVAGVWGVENSDAHFLIWNGAALLLMLVGVALMLKTKSFRWLIISFGVVVLINGLLHLIGSIVTWSYSPGLITSLLFWFPLGATTLFRAWRQVKNRRVFHAGVIVGIMMHVCIIIIVFGFQIVQAG